MTTTTALAKRRHDYMTPAARKKALRSLQLYLEGRRWDEIKRLGGYSWIEFSYRMMTFPDLSKAYTEARRASAHSFEDKALGLAEDLVAANEFTGTQVQAHKAAMEQFRWSATRRNPAEYAEAGANKVSLVVPIQINSSLNLAEGDDSGPTAQTSVWEAHAEIIERAQEPPEDAQEELEVQSEVEEAESSPASPPEALEDPLEVLGANLGLGVDVPAAIKQRKSPGGPRKKHKTAQATSVSRTNMLKRAAKNPTVVRALGLDPTNPRGPINELSKRRARNKPPASGSS